MTEAPATALRPGAREAGAARASGYAVDLALVFCLALGVRLLWALLIPPWQAPDEADHFQYVAYVVEQRRLPLPPHDDRYPFYSHELGGSYERTLVTRLSSLGGRGSPDLAHLPAGYDYAAARAYQTPSAERRSSSGGRASVYAPPYYLLQALPYRALQDAPILSRLFALRCGSALLGALSCLFGYLLAYELRHRAPGARRWGYAVGLAMALLPMYAAVTASVNNDAGMLLGASVLAWLAARVARQGMVSPKVGVALGLVSGLTYLMKPTATAMIAVAGLVLLVGAFPARRHPPRWSWRRLAALGGYGLGLVVTYAPWLAAQRYHAATVGAGSAAGAGAAGGGGGGLSTLVSTLVRVPTYSPGAYLEHLRRQGGEYLE